MAEVLNKRREIQAVIAGRRSASETLLTLLVVPGGPGKIADEMIAELFGRPTPRGKSGRYSTDVAAARSLIERCEGVETMPLGGGLWAAEVYQIARDTDGRFFHDQWQTMDNRFDVEAQGMGEAAAIVCALLIARAVQGAALLALAGDDVEMAARIDFARGCFVRPTPQTPPTSWLRRLAARVVGAVRRKKERSE